MIWDVSPEIVHLGPVTIRWYGLFFAISFLLGYEIMRYIFRKEHKPERNLSALLFVMMAGTVIGARLGHTLFYEPGFYLSNPLEILKVWKGGLASHGGALGILTALYFYSRKRPDQSFLWLLDRMVIPVAFAGFWIRMGNLMNSEIIGKLTELPWGVVFARVDALSRHPTQVYESLAYLIIFAILFAIYCRHKGTSPSGYLSGIFFTFVFSARFLIEFLKEPQANFEQRLWLDMGQILSVPLILIGAVLWARARRHKVMPPIQATSTCV